MTRRRAAPAPVRRTSGRESALALALAVVTLVTLARVLACNFVDYDDDLYVTANPIVQAGLTARGVAWAFTTFASFNWHPLTWLSHMLDCQLFGLDPRGHHLTSLLLHVATSVLLLHVLVRLTGARWRSALVAAVFAVHPLHVESVAWVAERKDVLCAFFSVLTLWAYVAYARAPGAGRYALVAACLALALLAKPMAVTLPGVLLLLDAWPLRRAAPALAASVRATPWAKLVLEKLPLLALAAVDAALTWAAQRRGGATTSLASLPPGARLAHAVLAYVEYLAKFTWPARLGVFYPLDPHVDVAAMVLALALLLAITAAVVAQRRARPYLAVGWGWYLGMLVPVIGLVQVGGQAVADRYLYLPSIGLALALVWGLADVVAALKPPRAAVAAGVAVILIALAARAFDQTRYWRDSPTLYAHTLSVTRDNPTIEMNYGLALMRDGRLDEARPHLDAAVRLAPRAALAHYDRGLLAERRGDAAAAADDYARAIALDPRMFDAHERLGILLFAARRVDAAVAQLAVTVELHPGDARVRDNYGRVLAAAGRGADAAAQFRRALELDPEFTIAREHLARLEGAPASGGR